MLREAEALAESLRDERRLGRALVLLANLAWTGRDLDRGLELGQRALAIAIGLNDVSLQTSVYYLLGVIGQTRGELSPRRGGPQPGGGGSAGRPASR